MTLEYFDGMILQEIRLHYPHCQHDKLVEVSEEVFDVLCQSVREMRNYERRKRYHRAYYSLDAYDWTENYALEHSPSPEQLVMLAEEQAERDRLAAALRETPGLRQRRRYSQRGVVGPF